MTISDVTFTLFSVFNGLRLLSYLPQIVRIARDEHGATSISFTCWSIWIGANASTAAYALLNLNDELLFLINLFNAICCVTVVALTLMKRHQWRALEQRTN